MATALGIPQMPDGTGLDALTHRRLIQALWQNPGIIGGLTVSGRSDLSYSVSPGAAIASRSEADGYVELYFPGGNTPSVAATDGGTSRVDTVYIVAHDATQGDEDNQVFVGVRSGQAAVSPVAPDISDIPGALPLAHMLMPPGASSTNSAQYFSAVSYAAPYGVGLGLIAQHRQPLDGVGDSDPRARYDEQHVTFNLPTRRIVRFTFQAAMSSSSTTRDSSWGITFCVDGAGLPDSRSAFHLTSTWTTEYHEFTTVLDAGQHTAFIRAGLLAGAAPRFHYTAEDDQDTWCGRVFRVYDEGVAAPGTPLYRESTDGSKWRY